jgi:hypothetical protein
MTKVRCRVLRNVRTVLVKALAYVEMQMPSGNTAKQVGVATECLEASLNPAKDLIIGAWPNGLCGDSDGSGAVGAVGAAGVLLTGTDVEQMRC